MSSSSSTNPKGVFRQCHMKCKTLFTALSILCTLVVIISWRDMSRYSVHPFNMSHTGEQRWITPNTRFPAEEHEIIEARSGYFKLTTSRWSNTTCRPQNNFVFIKTGKTGGSTAASILFRYASKNDLIPALDPKNGQYIGEDEDGNLDVFKYNCSNFPGYNFIANHIWYNRPAMEAVVPNAKYFTIIRSPYTHLKSRFYYQHRRHIFPNNSNPFYDFLRKVHKMHPEVNAELGNNYCRRFGIYFKNLSIVAQSSLEKINGELDLVMIMEHYDESLVLLKKIMCWEFEDILYYPMKVHTNPQPPMTPEMLDMISNLSRFDIEFFNYFNETLWKKIEGYDGNFDEDLATFQSMNARVKAKCDIEESSILCRKLKRDAHQLRHVLYSRNKHWIC
ncbi:galactosylceramide sulfotransferase-like [Ptychodera flava]|uniref:galactosylceramide sulfotransferase-like n=1 Tax=Ptychodera flava TaxID=63121 RepID=UPI00396A9B57